MEKAVLRAPDISCDHCIRSIRGAVEALPGVRLIEADIEGKAVTVEYDPAQAALPAIEDAMKDEGYPVAT
jgi:copper chaperone